MIRQFFPRPAAGWIEKNGKMYYINYDKIGM